MRTMMRVSIPVEAGNAAIKSGRLQQAMQEMLGRVHPEAAYFTADQGVRTCYLFIDMKDQSDIPALAEPFFLEFNAKVEFMPVMNAEDLQKALAKVAATV
jgi:hypothetical protein